mmetsp:Transcript_40896/g.60296  ORF Transcript_40896/g.60296 Transcript_40896/m.60296 type:complete len:106 (-) Transcript_40896:279-596(-)
MLSMLWAIPKATTHPMLPKRWPFLRKSRRPRITIAAPKVGEEGEPLTSIPEYTLATDIYAQIEIFAITLGATLMKTTAKILLLEADWFLGMITTNASGNAQMTAP